MAKDTRPTVSTPNEFDVLSGVWIFACNDEKPIITYRGLIYRLQLQPDYPIRELVSSRGDLFRRGVPKPRMERYKERMGGSKSMPSWLRAIPDESERMKAIDDLSPDDVLRSQFRTEKDAPQSDLGTIEWGLAHIDRLRKASLEAKSQKHLQLQMWLVLLVGLLNILATWATR